MSLKLEKLAKEYEDIAQEIEVVAKHYRTAAKHFRDKEVPRGIAHAFAGWGHIIKSEDILKSAAKTHADNSTP